jgi:hypothetical protein
MTFEDYQVNHHESVLYQVNILLLGAVLIDMINFEIFARFDMLKENKKNDYFYTTQGQ